MTAIIQRQQI